MSYRFKLYAAALVTAGILIALAWTGAAEMTHPQKAYIRCAAILADGPCAPDPSMQRLNGEPPLELRPVPQVQPLVMPPAR
jgi:hypothetical protein